MLKFISQVANFPIFNKFFLSLHRNPHILYYHMVGDKKPDYYYNKPTSPNDFRFQIEWLKKNKFEFVPLSEISNNTKNKRYVAVTTDDGFIENYTYIAPILSEYKIPATFFLLNNCIDNMDLMWRNKLFLIENKIGIKQTQEKVWSILNDQKLLQPSADIKDVYSCIPMKSKEKLVNEIWKYANLPQLSEFLNTERPYMSSVQIAELLTAGHSIGSHTFSHPDCSMLSYDELKLEIVDSITSLSDKFKVKIDYFAYPFGIRPGKELENPIFKLSNAKAFLGTKNSDSKLNGKAVWERDKMEQQTQKSLFWFSAVPILRKFFLKPLGIYK